MRFEFIVLIFLVLAVFIMVYAQTVIKSVNILVGIFAQKDSNFFESSKQEVINLDGETKLYIFKPGEGRYPAIIFSLGLWESGNDPILESPVEALVKSGFVVLLVESNDTKNGFITNNSVNSMISSFKYLQEQDYAKRDKIGFLGISVGSSIAFVAAASPEISEDVLFVLWLGGFYETKDYIVDVFSESLVHNGQVAEYKSDPKIKEVMIDNLMKLDEEMTGKLILTKDRDELKRILEDSDTRGMLDISPRKYVNDVKAKVFVIHDREDKLVPFTESIHLKEEKDLDGFVLTEIITHAVPEIRLGGIKAAQEFIKLVFLTNDVLALAES